MTSADYVTQAIKVQLIRKGMTQKQLSEVSGLNESQLNRYFTGAREWPMRILDAIAPARGWRDSLDIFLAAQNEKAPAATDAMSTRK